MGCRRQMDFVGEVIGEETDGDLALAVRVLVNRGGDDAFLKVRSHLGEKVCRDELYFSFEAARTECAANGKAINGIHIKSVQRRKTPE